MTLLHRLGSGDTTTATASKAKDGENVSPRQAYLDLILRDPIKERVLRWILFLRDAILLNPAQQGIECIREITKGNVYPLSWTELLRKDIHQRVQETCARLQEHIQPGSALMHAREHYYILEKRCREFHRAEDSSDTFQQLDFQRSRCKDAYKACLKEIEEKEGQAFNAIYPSSLSSADLLFNDTKKQIVIKPDKLENIVTVNISGSIFKETKGILDTHPVYGPKFQKYSLPEQKFEKFHKLLWTKTLPDYSLLLEMSKPNPKGKPLSLEGLFFEKYLTPYICAMMKVGLGEEKCSHPDYKNYKLLTDLLTLYNTFWSTHRLAMDIFIKACELKPEGGPATSASPLEPFPAYLPPTTLRIDTFGKYADPIKSLEKCASLGVSGAIALDCERQNDPTSKQKFTFDLTALPNISKDNCLALLKDAAQYKESCILITRQIEELRKGLTTDPLITSPRDISQGITDHTITVLVAFHAQNKALESVISTPKAP